MFIAIKIFKKEVCMMFKKFKKMTSVVCSGIIAATALAAPMGVGIGVNLPRIEPNLGIEPPISMRRVELVVLHERRLRELPPAL